MNKDRMERNRSPVNDREAADSGSAGAIDAAIEGSLWRAPQPEYDHPN